MTSDPSRYFPSDDADEWEGSEDDPLSEAYAARKPGPRVPIPATRVNWRKPQMSQETTTPDPRPTLYKVAAEGRVLMQTYDDLSKAKKDAQGYLLSRSRCKRAQVVTLAHGKIGGLGAFVATVTKDAKGHLKWTDHTAEPEPE